MLVDAENQVLGRFSSRVAYILRGKNKTNFTPHVDCGDNVIVINAEKIRLTGKKWKDRVYKSYTGYPGGQRFVTPEKLMQQKPTALVERSVYKMLPKNRLGERLKRNLFVYAGTSHPHEAQKPKSVKV